MKVEEHFPSTSKAIGKWRFFIVSLDRDRYLQIKAYQEEDKIRILAPPMGMTVTHTEAMWMFREIRKIMNPNKAKEKKE